MTQTINILVISSLLKSVFPRGYDNFISSFDSSFYELI